MSKALQIELIAATKAGDYHKVSSLLTDWRVDDPPRPASAFKALLNLARMNKQDVEVKNHSAVAKLLLEVPGIDINYTEHPGDDSPLDGRNNVLYMACSNNHMWLLELLLEVPSLNVNVEVDEPEMSTPLTAACEKGSTEIVAELLKRKDICLVAIDDRINAPIYVACANNQFGVVGILLRDARVNPDEKTERLYQDWELKDEMGDFSNSALNSAAAMGHFECVRLLLTYEGSIDVNTKDQAGRTPLHYVCINLSYDPSRRNDSISPYTHKSYKQSMVYVRIAKMLLSHPDIKCGDADRYGKTAIDYVHTIAKEAAHSQPPPMMFGCCLEELGKISASCQQYCNKVGYMLMQHPTCDFPSIKRVYGFKKAALKNISAVGVIMCHLTDLLGDETQDEISRLYNIRKCLANIKGAEIPSANALYALFMAANEPNCPQIPLLKNVMRKLVVEHDFSFSLFVMHLKEADQNLFAMTSTESECFEFVYAQPGFEIIRTLMLENPTKVLDSYKFHKKKAEFWPRGTGGFVRDNICV